MTERKIFNKYISKKCRKEKSEEIVKKMNQEQEEYKNIYENENNKNNKDNK